MAKPTAMLNLRQDNSLCYKHFYNNHVCVNLLAESLAKPGAAVSYKKHAEGKFTVEGMPEGIPFQKPNAYGANQRRKIWEVQDNIKFTIKDRESLLKRGSRTPGKRQDLLLNKKREVLEKILEPQTAEGILKGESKGTEDDIDITICLSPGDKQVLESMINLFDEDGKKQVRQLCLSTPTPPDQVIVPCFSDMENNCLFWLFKTTTAELEKNEELVGKWLQGEGDTYEIWSKDDNCINKENAILRDDCFIKYFPNIDFTHSLSGKSIVFNTQCLSNLETYIRSSLLLE